MVTHTREHMYPIFFRRVHGPDPQSIWLIGNTWPDLLRGHGVIRFFDGQDWRTQVAETAEQLRDVHAVSTTVAWTVGVNGLIMFTDDGGATWAVQPTGVGRMLNGVAAASPTYAWAVGEYGTILHTNDGGQSWTAQSSGTAHDLHSVSAASANEVWAVGENGTILHTPDAGATWKAQTGVRNVDMFDVLAVSSKQAWAVGASGLILFTEDRGQTWVKSEAGNQALLAVSGSPTDGFWAVGGDGTVLRNDGASWRQEDSGTSLIIGSVLVLPRQVLALSQGTSHKLLERSRSGQWLSRSEAPLQLFRGLASRFNEREVWAAGQDGKLMYSSDRGQTWRILFETPDEDQADVVALSVAPDRSIWAAGSGQKGGVMPNGMVVQFDGQSWNVRHTGNPNGLRGIAAVSKTHAWAVGVNQTILHTTDGGRTWSQQEALISGPVDFNDVAAVSET